MPIEIESVLGLLPELFPGVQAVPLANIRPNPDNPGPPISGGDLQALTEDIQENKLQNPLKLMPDPSGPLVAGVRIHPDNPRVTSEGLPWRVEDFRFITFSGNGRYGALAKLNWGKAPSYVMNPTPEEAVILGRIDNKVRQKGWWADYQDLERLIKANPSLTQRQVAVKLGLGRPKVTRAIGLLPLLDLEARGLIGTDSANSNKGIWGISELAVAKLADLGPGTGLKSGARKKEPAEEGVQTLWPYPPIPPETQDLVRRSLDVAIELKLTEEQTKKLVDWVQAGYGPEDYEKLGVRSEELFERQLEVRSAELGVDGKNEQPAEQPGEEALSGTEVAWAYALASAHKSSALLSGVALAKPDRNDSSLNVSKDSPRNDSKANPTPHPVLLPQGEKGATTPAAEAPSTSDGTSGLAQVLGGFLKGGHSGMGQALGGLAVGGVGAFLMSNGKRALGTLTRRYMMHGLVGVGALLIGVHFLPKGSHKPVQAPSVSASPVTASSAAAPNGVITVPPDLEGRVDDASILAQDFTRRFYGYEYLILSNWTSHLQQELAPEYSDAFFQAFMPPWKMDVITHRKLQAEFHPNQPAKLTALGPNGETFLVRGTAGLQSDLTDDDKPVAEGPVALEVHITHSPGDPSEGRVSLVEELTPLAFDFTPAGSARVGPKAKKTGDRSASSKKPTDQGTDPTAKFVGDAAGELAKKALGF